MTSSIAEPSPAITLTTDFGSVDHFVGVMKGVIAAIAPSSRIIDITHEIPPYAIEEAAFVVSQTYPYFAPGTIHTIVVDPGVGSARRPILVEAAGQIFIGPDNGIFGMVLARESCTIRAITNDELFRKPVSQTFHGRDIFAPVAAHIAAGVSPSAVGDPIEDYHKSAVGFAPQRTGKRTWTGAILKIDRFGNLITNFHHSNLPDLTLRNFEMQVGLRKVEHLAKSYADARSEVFAIVGSSGFLEVSANKRSAAKLLGVGTGSPVELTLL